MKPSRRDMALRLLLSGSLAYSMAPGVLGAEFGITGSFLSGDYGGGSSSRWESVSLNVVTGERVRFRAYLPLIRYETSGEVLWTSAGPTTVGEQGRDAAGPDGGNDPGGTGNQYGSAGDSSGSGQTQSGPGGGSESSSPDAQQAVGSSTDAVGGSTLLPTETASYWTSGVGDLRLGLGGLLAGGGAKLHRLDASLDVKVPSADAETIGTGEWDLRLGMSAQRRVWTGTWFGGAGYNWIGDPDWIDFNDAADLWGGFESEPFGPRLMATGWVEANQEVVPGVGHRVVVGAGLRRFAAKSWRVSVVAGLTDAAEDFGVHLGWSWDTVGPRRIRPEPMP